MELSSLMRWCPSPNLEIWGQSLPAFLSWLALVVYWWHFCPILYGLQLKRCFLLCHSWYLEAFRARDNTAAHSHIPAGCLAPSHTTACWVMRMSWVCGSLTQSLAHSFPWKVFKNVDKAKSRLWPKDIVLIIFSRDLLESCSHTTWSLR